MTFRQFAYRNVVRNKRIYAAYLVSSSFSVMIFFVCALFIFNPVIREGLLIRSAVQIMIVAECIMYLFAFLFVLYSVRSFLNNRKREFGIYMLHGMSKKQLDQLIFWENMIIGAAAIVSGIVAGLLTGKLFLMISSAFLGMESIPLYVSWQSLAWTAGSFILLFLVISIFSSRPISTSKLVELIQSGQRSKASPNVSISLSLLATVFLVLSYYLAATTTVATVYIRMFPVIVMTIAGTYFFYTQLSGFILMLMKRYRRLFWQHTNVITISSLAYRFKDHARMFFMVTIISTVSFCSVGVFASVNTLMRSFQEDYPAAVGYLAKQGSTVEKKHLELIEEELAAKNISYVVKSMPIKYVDVTLSRSPNKAEELPVISFSDYMQAVQAAGRSIHEVPLTANDALVILTSQREKSYIGVRPKESYTLHSYPGIIIHEIGYTEHVPLPDYLSAELHIDTQAEIGGLVISDELFGRLHEPEKVDQYTGFYVEDFLATSGVAQSLANEGLVRYDANKPYAITVSGTLYAVQKSLYSMLLLISLLLGAVFFIGAGSFLYFRLYADLDYDRRQSAIIAKVGLTEKELSRIVTRQLAILFFVPIGVAVIHSLFAFAALQTLFYLSVAAELGIVLISFLVAQIIYFYFIRQRYLRNLRKRMI